MRCQRTERERLTFGKVRDFRAAPNECAMLWHITHTASAEVRDEPATGREGLVMEFLLSSQHRTEAAQRWRQRSCASPAGPGVIIVLQSGMSTRAA